MTKTDNEKQIGPSLKKIGLFSCLVVCLFVVLFLLDKQTNFFATFSQSLMNSILK